MILVVQRAKGPGSAALVARLYQAGHEVRIATSKDEAVDLLGRRPAQAIVLNDPDVASGCSRKLCHWITESLQPRPPVFGLLHVEDPAQRARCEACVEVLHPETPPPAIARMIDDVVRGDGRTPPAGGR